MERGRGGLSYYIVIAHRSSLELQGAPPRLGGDGIRPGSNRVPEGLSIAQTPARETDRRQVPYFGPSADGFVEIWLIRISEVLFA
jgi:hypothetical protein